MEKKTFKDLFEQARKRDEYWIAYTKLEFTEELRRLMGKKKETKASLAKKLGKSPAYITKIFRGNANFTLESMVRLVRAIGGRLKIELEAETAKQVQAEMDRTTYISTLISPAQASAGYYDPAKMINISGGIPNVSVHVVSGKSGTIWTKQDLTLSEILISPKSISLSGEGKNAKYDYATA